MRTLTYPDIKEAVSLRELLERALELECEAGARALASQFSHASERLCDFSDSVIRDYFEYGTPEDENGKIALVRACYVHEQFGNAQEKWTVKQIDAIEAAIFDEYFINSEPGAKEEVSVL